MVICGVEKLLTVIGFGDGGGWQTVSDRLLGF